MTSIEESRQLCKINVRFGQHFVNFIAHWGLSDRRNSTNLPRPASVIQIFLISEDRRRKTIDDDKKDLQVVLSLTILMHSAIDSLLGRPVQSFTSSVQRLFGLDYIWILFPLMRPCRIAVERFFSSDNNVEILWSGWTRDVEHWCMCVCILSCVFPQRHGRTDCRTTCRGNTARRALRSIAR